MVNTFSTQTLVRLSKLASKDLCFKVQNSPGAILEGGVANLILENKAMCGGRAKEATHWCSATPL